MTVWQAKWSRFPDMPQQRTLRHTLTKSYTTTDIMQYLDKELQPVEGIVHVLSGQEAAHGHHVHCPLLHGRVKILHLLQQLMQVAMTKWRLDKSVEESLRTHTLEKMQENNVVNKPSWKGYMKGLLDSNVFPLLNRTILQTYKSLWFTHKTFSRKAFTRTPKPGHGCHGYLVQNVCTCSVQHVMVFKEMQQL